MHMGHGMAIIGIDDVKRESMTEHIDDVKLEGVTEHIDEVIGTL